MIIEVGIRHAAETKVRGRTKTRHYDAVVPLRIREASGADAPGVAWWPRPRPGNAAPATVCLRSFDGALWQPAVDGDQASFARFARGRTETVSGPEGLAKDDGASFARQGRGKASVMTEEGLEGFLRGAMGRPADSHRLDDYAGTVLAEDPLVKEVSSSELPALTAAMQALSTGWALVDGVAHRRIAHPMYEFDGDRAFATIRTATSDDCDHPGNAYPILRYEEACAAFRKASPGRHSADMARGLKPTILEPSLLAFDTAAWLGGTLVERVVGTLSSDTHTSMSYGSRVAHLSREAMAAFAALRDMDPLATPGETLRLLSGYDGSDGSEGEVARLLSRRDEFRGAMARMRTEVAAVEADVEATSTMPVFA